jgi:hypothetical protein
MGWSRKLVCINIINFIISLCLILLILRVRKHCLSGARTGCGRLAVLSTASCGTSPLSTRFNRHATTSARTDRSHKRKTVRPCPVLTCEPHQSPPDPPARPPNLPRRAPGASQRTLASRVPPAPLPRPAGPSRQLQSRARVHMIATGKLPLPSKRTHQEAPRPAWDRHQAHRVRRFARAHRILLRPRSISSRSCSSSRQRPGPGLGTNATPPAPVTAGARDMMPACLPAPAGEGSSPDRPSAPRRRYEQTPASRPN